MSSTTAAFILAGELSVRVPRLRSIDETLLLMRRVQETFGRNDGIWWFTELYRLVTEAVQIRCREEFFKDPAWVGRLVIEFSKMYFDALWLWLAGERSACPAPWRVLFAKRFIALKPGYSPLQCALAGVNAHIQRDLGFAAWRASCLLGKSFSADATTYRDYVRVNAILDQVEVEAMRLMATGWVRRVSGFMHPFDQRAAMVLIHATRWLAWRTAAIYLRLLSRSPDAASLWLAVLDGYGWLCGRILLLPSFSHDPTFAREGANLPPV